MFSFSFGVRKSLRARRSTLLTPVVGLCVVWATMLPADAAEWKYAFEVSGSEKSASPASTSYPNGDWSTAPPCYIQKDNPPLSAYPNGFLWPNTQANSENKIPAQRAIAKTKGTLTLVCTWTASSSTDITPVPPILYVKITSGASATGYYRGSTYYGDVSVNVDNGFGSPVSDFINQYSSTNGSRTASAQGSFLKQMQTNGQKVVRIKFPEVSATADGPIGADLKVSISSQVDSRGVRIVRNSAPAPKKADDSTLKTQYDEWVEADGTGHGHTRYSYEAQLDTAGYTTNWNGQNLTAVRSGSWGSSLAYWWNPTGGAFGNPYDNDTIDGSLQQMPKGTPYKDVNGNWQGDSSPKGVEQTITYTLQDKSDSSAPKAVAKYKLMLHDEFENPVITSDVGRWSFGTRSIANNIEQTNQSSSAKDFDYKITKTVSDSFEGRVSFGASAGYKVPGLDKLGIDLSPIKVDVATETKNQESTEIAIATGPTITLQPGQASYPIIQIISHHRVIDVDQYSSAGYVGKATLTTDTFNDVNPGQPVSPQWVAPYSMGTGGGNGSGG